MTDVQYTFIKEDLRVGQQFQELEELEKQRTCTSLRGYIAASYWQLAYFLGVPVVGPTPDGKVNVRWFVDTPTGLLEIYDYKGNPDLKDPLEVVNWQIGGRGSLYHLHSAFSAFMQRN